MQLAATRPEEELYDLNNDPWEIKNLAADQRFRKQLVELRGFLANWELDTDDQGRFPESDAAYDGEMAAYVEKARRRSPEQAAALEANISLMKRWAASGK